MLINRLHKALKGKKLLKLFFVINYDEDKFIVQ